MDPASLPINADLGNFYCLALGKPDLGIVQLKKTIELEPNWPRAHALLSNCHGEKGMWNEAMAEIQKMGTPSYPARARVYAATGRHDEALKVIAEMKEDQNGNTSRQLVSQISTPPWVTRTRRWNGSKRLMPNEHLSCVGFRQLGRGTACGQTHGSKSCSIELG